MSIADAAKATVSGRSRNGLRSRFPPGSPTTAAARHRGPRCRPRPRPRLSPSCARDRTALPTTRRVARHEEGSRDTSTATAPEGRTARLAHPTARVGPSRVAPLRADGLAGAESESPPNPVSRAADIQTSASKRQMPDYMARRVPVHAQTASSGEDNLDSCSNGDPATRHHRDYERVRAPPQEPPPLTSCEREAGDAARDRALPCRRSTSNSGAPISQVESLAQALRC